MFATRTRQQPLKPDACSLYPRLSWSQKGVALAEYDSLAYLYDLEYVHDHDVPFWLALADREPGPVVEWGAGTGRSAQV